MKNIAKYLLSVSFIFIAIAVEAKDHARSIKGLAVTGTNRLYNKPVTDYGRLGTIGFYNLGAHNPNGNFPLIIDQNTSEDAFVATAVDPEFLTIVGLPPELIDEDLNNIPLANVAVNISPTGEDRMTLPSTFEVDPLIPNQANPIPAITLKEWLKAKGTAKIRCNETENSIVIRAENLLPNRLYTVWGIFETHDAQFAAVPLGGVPNVITTDSKGKGEFRRDLGFCPLERTKSGNLLLAIDVLYHSDHQLYGQMPDLALKSLITGTINHTQLEFTVSGQSLLGKNIDAE